MATKQCTVCGQIKPLSEYPACREAPTGRLTYCRECKNAKQRLRRALMQNDDTRRYEKTKHGFLMRLYRNMESRITGVQHQKHHLYAGKDLLPRDDFYAWAAASPEFHRLFAAWESAGYMRKFTPSVDRLKSGRGYEMSNMEWVTHSENSRRGSVSNHRIHKRVGRRLVRRDLIDEPATEAA